MCPRGRDTFWAWAWNDVMAMRDLDMCIRRENGGIHGVIFCLIARILRNLTCIKLSETVPACLSCHQDFGSDSVKVLCFGGERFLSRR